MNQKKKLGNVEKLLIFLSVPLLIIHPFWIAANFGKGGKNLRDEHYHWLKYGGLFYLLVTLLFAYLTRQ